MVDGNKIIIIFYFIYCVCANYKCCIMPYVEKNPFVILYHCLTRVISLCTLIKAKQKLHVFPQGFVNNKSPFGTIPWCFLQMWHFIILYFTLFIVYVLFINVISCPPGALIWKIKYLVSCILQKKNIIIHKCSNTTFHAGQNQR
jgi:hypothetical protein